MNNNDDNMKNIARHGNAQDYKKNRENRRQMQCRITRLRRTVHHKCLGTATRTITWIRQKEHRGENLHTHSTTEADEEKEVQARETTQARRVTGTLREKARRVTGTLRENKKMRNIT